MRDLLGGGGSGRLILVDLAGSSTIGASIVPLSGWSKTCCSLLG